MAQTDGAQFPPAPIILLTGANGAVGLGICLRLLYQLSQPTQSDVARSNVINFSSGPKLVERNQEEDFQSVYATPNGLTLLLGCRSEEKANDARKKLLKQLNRLFSKESSNDQADTTYTFIDRITGQVETISFEVYRRKWLENLKIEFLPLDLSNLNSIFQAVDRLSKNYGYISHLLLNAGGGLFIGLDWVKGARSVCRNFVEAMTYPDYLIERRSTETDDKLGHIWQLNVFGHYLLARLSLPLLSRSPCPAPARIIWTGSMDGMARYFETRDYQCLESSKGYQSTKYQVGMIGWTFNSVIREYEASIAKGDGTTSKSEKHSTIHSLVAHPGIVAGNMFTQIIGDFLDFIMLIVMYITRSIFGSSHHVVSAYKAGLVWSFACLGPPITGWVHETSDEDDRPFRLGARCGRLGSEYVAFESNDETEGNGHWFDRNHAKFLSDICNQLYEVYSRKHQLDHSPEPAN